MLDQKPTTALESIEQATLLTMSFAKILWVNWQSTCAAEPSSVHLKHDGHLGHIGQVPELTEKPSAMSQRQKHSRYHSQLQLLPAQYKII